jgi:hypothetical protein
MITEIIDQGEKKLAVSLGRSASGRSLSKLTALRGSPGWIASENRVDEWRFDGFLDRDGELYLYGPYLEGKSLDSILSLGLAEALPYVARIAGALALLAERKIPLFPIQTDSVFFCADGGVLFLPPEVLREMRGLRTAEVNLETFERINHPELNGELLVSFSIAALLYKFSTGAFPFGGRTVEQAHEEARKHGILAPDRIIPGLSPELSGLVMSGLGRGSGGQVGLQTWKEKTEGWLSEPLVKEPSPEEKQRITREAALEKKKADRRFTLSVFWEKNRIRVAVAAGILIIAGFLTGQAVKHMLAPSVIQGFPPEKVVETFYLSMNTFDHSTMSACVTGKAGSGEINEAMNIYVISRVAMGYGGKSNIASAGEWDKAGRPELQPLTGVYGVTGLTVTQESGEPEPVFLVRYVKWRPTSRDSSLDKPGTIPPGPYFEAANVTDRVSLKLDRGDWKIYDIERLQEAPLADLQKK